ADLAPAPAQVPEAKGEAAADLEVPEWRSVGGVADLGAAGVPRRHDAEPHERGDRGCGLGKSCNVASWRHASSLRSRPVICGGCSMPSSASSVGPTSHNAPP